MSRTPAARLVVTGHSPEGRAVFVSDAAAPELDLAGGAVRMRMLWGRDDVAAFPDSGAAPAATAAVPPPGGCRFATLTIAAGANEAYHGFIVAAMGDRAEPENPGFHRTPSLDFIVVLEGEITLELDSQQQRVMRRGDMAVLNGVRHRWANHGSAEATIAAVMIGAASRAAIPPTGESR
jgi:hypothetical protein